MDRRDILKVMGAGAAWAATGQVLAITPKSGAFGGEPFALAIARVQRRVQGRLGVAVLDLQTGARFAQHGDERFPMCSTFKFLLTAAVLHAADHGRLRLDRSVVIPRTGIAPNSPAVAPMVGRTMTVAELCAGTMTRSDNEAANLLLPLVGGTAGFNAFTRLLGDRTTRLDRGEPGLNMGTPGDPRDTTTPNAMLASMNAALFGRTLSAAARSRLTGWLIANRTGTTRLRAGIPAGWRVGDKTGTGDNGTANDIGVLWPGRARRPILVTSYLTGANATQELQYAAHADVARAIAAAVG
jgi:beta-lactamase class A